MPIITFWSDDVTRETGKTTSIAAIATKTAIEHNLKILLLPTDYCDDSLEKCFWNLNERKASEINLKNVSKTRTVVFEPGVEGLAKAVFSNRLSPELVHNYTKTIFKERLEFLPTIKNSQRDIYRSIMPIYKDIIKSAEKYYDLVFVDLNKGSGTEFINEVLGISELIILNVTQNMDMIDNFIELRKANPNFKGKNVMLLLGRYDRDSKYNAKNIARYIGEKKEINTVPYCTSLFEATIEGKVADLFLKLRIIDSNNYESFFLSEVLKTINKILSSVKSLQKRI